MKSAGKALATRARARESDIQRAIVKYCNAVLPHGLCFAVPNASLRTADGRASNYVPGLLPGVSDLIVLTPKHVIFAEVKGPRGVVSPEQRAFAEIVQSLGFAWCCWKGIDDARLTFRALGISTREAK